MKGRRRAAAALAGTLVLLGAAACDGEAPREDGGAPAIAAQEDGLSRTTEEGPVKATVSLAPREPRLGDHLVLTLTVEAAPDVVVEMPAFGEALGRFSIVDFTPRQETRDDGSTVASQRYTLQAPMSGQQRIPPLRIEFLDQRDGMTAAGAEEEYRELLTDELGVQVASVLPEGAVADELRPARGALEELSTGAGRRWALVLGILALVGAAAAATILWRRRAAERARVTAYDKAMKRLRALESRGFPTPEEADGWYVDLSDLIRRYLEDRYAVRAPELTTEEFLQEARRSPELSAPHQQLLSSFLERCDRVKFAAYHPEESESRQVLDAARRFLDETRTLPEEETSAGRTAA